MACFRKCFMGHQDKTVILRSKSYKESARKNSFEQKWIKGVFHSELYKYASSLFSVRSLIFAVNRCREDKPSSDGYPSCISVQTGQLKCSVMTESISSTCLCKKIL